MNPHYRVAIFGSARIKPEDPEYIDVFNITRGLAESGFDIVTGGGPGLMEAANAGHKSIASDLYSIGLNIKLPHEQHSNKYLDINQDFDKFSDRLDAFMSLSDAVIVAPGGIGTLLELFYTWQLMQVQHICETPIILFGQMWTGLIAWLQTEVLAKQFFTSHDLHNIFQLNSVREVIDFINRVHSDRFKMEHVCVNYSKYRLEFSMAPFLKSSI
ncbi:LOG family protein [Pleurocapsales cyanobacterium LEGE 06147]|nr:LOG family protein [Pleurocapsales cyanobacterium LEGE 06147]